MAFEVNSNLFYVFPGVDARGTTNLGTFNTASGGVRLKLLSGPKFSLAARGQLQIDSLFTLTEQSDGTLNCGEFRCNRVFSSVTPGVLASFGGPKTQLSFGLDIPIQFLTIGTFVSGLEVLPAVGTAARVFSLSVTLELPLRQKSSLYFQSKIVRGFGMLTGGITF